MMATNIFYTVMSVRRPPLSWRLLLQRLRKSSAGDIGEYWIIDAKKRIVEQYILRVSDVGTYVLQGKFEAGDEVNSVSIPGFVIPVSAVFDKTENMLALRKIV